MPNTNLEKAIAEAANAFALEIIEAVKNATLQELIDMQSIDVAQKSGTTTNTTTLAQRPAAPKKKIKKRNYPKCAFPGCEKNRFVRGKGFCGEHWKQHQAGKISAAEEL